MGFAFEAEWNEPGSAELIIVGFELYEVGVVTLFDNLEALLSPVEAVLVLREELLCLLLTTLVPISKFFPFFPGCSIIFPLVCLGPSLTYGPLLVDCTLPKALLPELID